MSHRVRYQYQVRVGSSQAAPAASTAPRSTARASQAARLFLDTPPSMPRPLSDGFIFVILP